jgi:DNA polymerase I
VLLLLDGNNLAWAGFYALERAMKPDSEERRERVALLGLASGVLGAVARDGEPPGERPRTPVTRVAVCFDRGRPLRRRETFPPYQTGREGDDKFVANEPTVLRAVARFCEVAERALPFEVLHGENTEADDLIAGLVQRTPGPKRIVSTDRDFLQLVGPETSVYAPVKKLVIDDANFEDAAMPRTSSGDLVAFPRERFLDFRVLTGDTSDNVPGVPGVGALSAAKLLAAGALDDYLRDPALVRPALGRRSDAVERAFADGTAAAVVERNRALMDLRRPAPCWDRLDELTTHGRWDRPAFERWYEEQKITAVDPTLLFPRLESLAR